MGEFNVLAELQPYLRYVGIGLGAIVGIVVLIWVTASLYFFWKTRGLKRFVDQFWGAIAINDIKSAYALTTDNFKAQTPVTELRKFVKRHKLNLNKTVEMPIPELDGATSYRLDTTVELENEDEIAISMRVQRLAHQTWALDAIALTADLNPPTVSENRDPA